jgi:hypothetical protein
MSYTEPALSQLAAIFRSYPQDRADTSLAALLSVTGGSADLANARQRLEFRRWLNKWVCRLRYPQPGEPDPFSDSLALWWEATGSGLPDSPVAELNDNEVAVLAASYADLASRPGALLTRNGVPAGYRTIGPTAASKIMFVLRPHTVPPWDAAIARSTTGGTSLDHFRRHLEAARVWATAILDEARRDDIPDIPGHVGRPGSSLAKLRDEWMYLTITRGCAVPPR